MNKTHGAEKKCYDHLARQGRHPETFSSREGSFVNQHIYIYVDREDAPSTIEVLEAHFSERPYIIRSFKAASPNGRVLRRRQHVSSEMASERRGRSSHEGGLQLLN